MTRLVLISCFSAVCLSTSALAQDTFTLDNNTGYTITAVFAAPSEDDDWGPNILGERIAHRETMEVTLDTETSGCMWDLRYEFSDGEFFEEYEVDVCRISGESYILE
ncbi:hypothetical protein SAMN05444340_11372 [Citreimonas salinaria]|uniref:Argininosuccinate lyase n=2 Tax=Citreimonas salinaria TaxID=321339 RepID=A0A1H3LL07_9RHOB|nr:hypothetical protein SAMN05444340_11372 [Citreimonas salinaria]